MNRLKTEQRDRKKRENNQAVYAQDDRSSVSSSDEERLDRLEGEGQEGRANFSSGTGGNREGGTARAFAKDVRLQNAARWDKMKREYGRGGGVDGAEVDGVQGGAEEGVPSQPPPQQQQQ